MSKRKFKRFKDAYITPILLVFLSFIVVSLNSNNFFSFVILSCGLLNGWYASLGKWYNYIFGIIFTICNAYVSYNENLFGMAALSLLLYLPIQILGLYDWYKRKNKNSEVRVRGFNIKSSILVIVSCFCGSIAFGTLLGKIPNQELAFLDSTSNVLNICGIILMNLRFSECWWIMLGNNVADLVIWIINYSEGSIFGSAMLLVSTGYLIMNITGLLKWKKIKNKIRY